MTSKFRQKANESMIIDYNAYTDIDGRGRIVEKRDCGREKRSWMGARGEMKWKRAYMSKVRI